MTSIITPRQLHIMRYLAGRIGSTDGEVAESDFTSLWVGGYICHGQDANWFSLTALGERALMGE